MLAVTDTITEKCRSIHGIYIRTKSNLCITSTYEYDKIFTLLKINNIMKIRTPVEILVIHRDDNVIQLSIPGFVLTAEHSKKLSTEHPVHVFTSCEELK